MSAEIPHPYPPPLDPWALSRELVPPAHASEGWLAFVRAGLAPICRTSTEVAEVARQLADPEQARGEVLDAIGSWIGVQRGGLPDYEYRRLVVGGLAARQAATRWTHSRALAMWRDLTGDPDATVRTGAPGSVIMQARLAWTPSDSWVREAGRVVGRSIRLGLSAYAVVTVDGGMVWDAAGSGWGSSLWGWLLPTDVE